MGKNVKGNMIKNILVNKCKKCKPNINLTVVRCEPKIWEDLRIF